MSKPSILLSRVTTVWKFAKNYKLLFILAEICILLSYAVSIILPLNLTNLIDNVLYKSKFDALPKVLIIYAVLFLTAVIFNMIYAYVFQSLNNRFVVDVKNALYYKVIYAKADFLSNINTGDIMSRIDNDADQFIFIVQRNLFHFLNSIIMCIGIFTVLAIQNAAIAMMALAAAILPIAVSRIYARITENIVCEKRTIEGDYEGKLFEILKGMREIRLLCAKKWARFKVLTPIRKLIEIDNKLRRINFITEKAVSAVNLIVLLIIYVYSVDLIGSYSITAGVFLAVIEYVALLHRKIEWIVMIYLDWSGRKISIDRISEILNLSTESKGESKKSVNGEIEKLEFKNVFFKYGEKEVLRNVSFIVNKGEKVAIVGFSGAGKTTAIDLITKLLEPQRGEILINDVDLKNIDCKLLRDNIGVVKQEALLFNMPGADVRFNLTLGKSGYEDKDLMKALHRVGLNDIELDRSGSKLSGGQKQRVMIARVMLKNAGLMIFDEATSALDIETENVIAAEQLNGCSEDTIIVISHRFSTIKNCNRVIVINDGTVEADGTHEELLIKSKTYGKLFGQENCGKEANI